MGVTPSVLTTGGTDTLANNWTTATISPKTGSLVVVVAAFYDAADYFSTLKLDDSYDLGQNWKSLSTHGYTSSLGNVSGAYTIMKEDASDVIKFTTNGENNYDAVSWVVVEFIPTANERFAYSQETPVTFDTPPVDRSTADNLAAPPLPNSLQKRNLIVGYAGAFNTTNFAISFSTNSGWTLAGEKSQAAGGATKQILSGVYYAIDTTDTTFSSSVSVGSDYHYVGAAEFKRERYVRPVMSFIHD